MHEALAKWRCLYSSLLRFHSQCLSHCLIKNIWKRQCNNKTFSHSKHYHHICWAPDSIILLKCITDVAQTKWVQDVQSDTSAQESVSWQKAGSVAYILPAQPSPFFPPLPPFSLRVLAAVSISSNYSNWMFLWKQTRRHSTSPLKSYKNKRCTSRKQKGKKKKLLPTMRKCTAFNSLTEHSKPGPYWCCQVTLWSAGIPQRWLLTEAEFFVLFSTQNYCGPQVPTLVALIHSQTDHTVCNTRYDLLVTPLCNHLVWQSVHLATSQKGNLWHRTAFKLEELGMSVHPVCVLLLNQVTQLSSLISTCFV